MSLTKEEEDKKYKEEVIAFLTKNAMEREAEMDMETDYPDDVDVGVEYEIDSQQNY